MSSLIMAAWLLSVPVPDEIATREQAPLTRQDIAKRLQQAVVRGPKPTQLTELMAEAVRLLGDEPLPETLPAFGNDAAGEARFRQVVENEQKQMSLRQYKLSVMLNELKINQGELAKEPKQAQAGYWYICAHMELRIAQMYEANALMGDMRKEIPPTQPGQTSWRLALVRQDVKDRDAAKNMKAARGYLQKLIQDHAGSEWERRAAEETKDYLIGVKWEPGK